MQILSQAKIYQAIILSCCLLGWSTGTLAQDASTTFLANTRDTSGNPVPGVIFTLIPVEQHEERRAPVLTLTSSGDGTTAAPVVSGVTYRVTFAGTGLGELVSLSVDGERVDAGTAEARAGSPRAPIIIVVGERPVVLSTVWQATSRVAGIINSSGRAARYSDMSIRVQSTNGVYLTPVGADGAFSLSVPSFPVTLEPRDSDGTWSFDPDHRVLESGDDQDLVVFNASKNSVDRVGYRVVDRKDGDPLSGFKAVAVWCDGDEERFRKITSDEDGQGDLPCVPGCLYRFSFGEQGSYPRRMVRKTIEDCDKQVRLELSKGGTVAVVVNDHRGNPASGVLVRLQRDGWTGGAIAETDGEGKFRSEALVKGAYRISVADTSTLAIVDSQGEIPRFVIEDADAEVSLRLRVVEGGRVCVNAVDPEQEPVSLKELIVFDEDGETVVQRPRTRMGHAQSELCSKSLPPGNYYVKVERGKPTILPAWWPGTSDRDLATTVEIAAGDRLVLEPFFLTYAGTIRFDFGSTSAGEEWRIEIQKQAEDDDRAWIQVNPAQVAVLKDKRWNVAVPTGFWNLRVCSSEDCEADLVWSSETPTRVRTGAVVEIDVPVQASDAR